MEKDPEIKGEGNSYTTEFRQYDPRLGRWLSLDPLMSMFPSLSPYCAFDNNPIFYTDIYGLSAGGPPEKSNTSSTIEGSYDEHSKKLEGMLPEGFKDRGDGSTHTFTFSKDGKATKVVFTKESQGQIKESAFRGDIAFATRNLQNHSSVSNNSTNIGKTNDQVGGQEEEISLSKKPILHFEIDKEIETTPTKTNEPIKSSVIDKPKEVSKPRISKDRINQIQQKFTEASIISLPADGSGFRPIVSNKSVPGSAFELGKTLAKYSFESVTINFTLGHANRAMLVPKNASDFQKAADMMYNQIANELVKSGVPKSKIHKGIVKESGTSEINFGVVIK